MVVAVVGEGMVEVVMEATVVADMEVAVVVEDTVEAVMEATEEAVMEVMVAVDINSLQL